MLTLGLLAAACSSSIPSGSSLSGDPLSKAADELAERLIGAGALVNEGAKILEEGMALRASDIDVIYANGYGFPRYRAGPMLYADMIGLDKVYRAICGYHEKFGDIWEPAPLLKELAEQGKSFSDL